MQQFCLDITVINSCIYALCVSCLCHLHNTAKHKDHLSIVLFLKSYSKFPPPLMNVTFWHFICQIIMNRLLMEGTYTDFWPSWSYGSWIYNYLCNQCPSPLKLGIRIPLREVLSIQHYVIKFVSDLRQVCNFLWEHQFPLPI